MQKPVEKPVSQPLVRTLSLIPPSASKPKLESGPIEEYFVVFECLPADFAAALAAVVGSGVVVCDSGATRDLCAECAEDSDPSSDEDSSDA